MFPLPALTADDEWVRRAFAPRDVAFVPACTFTARAPRTLHALVQTRRRSLRGSKAITAMGITSPRGEGAVAMLRAALPQPRLWAAMAVYVLVMVWVRLLLATETTITRPKWERDLTNRTRHTES